MTATKIPTRSVTVVTRALDAVDRAHARAATVLHGVRNKVLSAVEHGIDRVDQLASSAFQRARRGVQRVDVVSADVVNRAQGVVGQAIEKARLTRSQREHVMS
jgi:hypothetical protein